MLFSSYCG